MAVDEKLVQRLLKLHGDGDASEALVLADYFLEQQQKRLAVSALDLAWGRDPDNSTIAAQRAAILDELSVEEHGLIFRYIPAGTFRMGTQHGERDERPAHAVRLDDYWMADIPITWSAWCDLMAWEPPPQGGPRQSRAGDAPRAGFYLREENKVRLQYCETETQRAGDWHAHAADLQVTGPDGSTQPGAAMFGEIPRENPQRPYSYNVKPMVAVSWIDTEELCEKLSTASVRYTLPTEAQWEKAARGGLIDSPYAWGREAPSPDNCDFGHFRHFVIRPPRTLPPNGYGLFGMCGGVWEWTRDEYDALAYRSDAPKVSVPPDQPRQRVLRGGSWADCAEAVTVTYRMSRPATSWRQAVWGGHLSPTIGMRLCRTVTSS